MASSIDNLPEKYDDLPNKRQYWPAAAGSAEEGLGMLRILTPEIVANAARTQIQTGLRVCLNWDLENLDVPGFGRKAFEHRVKWLEPGIAFDDEYHFNPQQSSQWDGLRHHSAPDPTSNDEARRVFYGGTAEEEILDPNSTRIGIGYWAKKGIAGRGVLIDYLSWAEKKGITVDGLSQHAVPLDDVLAIARECNIEFQRGDIFFLRVGLTKTWCAMSDAQKQAYGQQTVPKHAGLEQSERVLRFMWDNHFSAVASDAVSFEVFPPLNSEFDLHHHMLAGWGLPIGEMFDLEELAETCKQLGRWTFFISSSPLNCAKGPNTMALPLSLRMENLRELLPGLSSIMSWKMLAVVLAIINLKNLPLVWHIRVLHYIWWNIRRKPQDPYFPKGKAMVTHTGKPTHPVFVPYGITSRTPILETDYNFHKSNSTYFSDLDISRTALVTRIVTPGVSIVSKELDAELRDASLRDGKKPSAPKAIYIALGSVYCSFKREIKPFELYEIESRIVSWDEKWMYILSFFLRPAAKKGGKRTLFATALAKYVVKKGRLTVPPERVLRASGYLPPRPEGAVPEPGLVDSPADVSGAGTPSEGIAASSGVDGSLVREVLKLNEGDISGQGNLAAKRKENADSWNTDEWTWERIEEERLRGLKVVEGYVSLDAKLHEEWER
ncbi:hypothetical protein BDV25DRAFT_130396 [Aspergillus avenaceus]|uniref:Uncharacterized protein n=1 Tax=Aspergillus avenaceus TaxID=36643 RepID=A0A5N6TSR7_ASPAV|nr:hypothetical protein BDV25DRAFT_130396 [Aspergillus avenaceus]